MRSRESRNQRFSVLSSGNNSSARSSVLLMSSAAPERATQRNGPLPSQNNGRIYSGTNPGMRKESATPTPYRLGANVVAVFECHRPTLLHREHGPDMVRDRRQGAPLVLGRIVAAQGVEVFIR